MRINKIYPGRKRLDGFVHQIIQGFIRIPYLASVMITILQVYF